MSLTRTNYATQPEPMDYHQRPDYAWSEVWLRKNIEEVPDPVEEGHENTTHWEADEAYFCTDASREDIMDDFEGFFEEAAGWEPETEKDVDIHQLRADVDYLLMKEG